MPLAVVQSTLNQLKQRNALHRDAFSEVVADYQTCLQRSRDFQVRHWAQSAYWRMMCTLRVLVPSPEPSERHVVQVRAAQLDKEASELRLENETLLRSLEEQKRSAVLSTQACRRPPARLPSLSFYKLLPTLGPLLPARTKLLSSSSLCSVRRWRHEQHSCRRS